MKGTINDKITHLYFAGDSTVCDWPQEKAPQAGWGQWLAEVLQRPNVIIHNEAVSGRSSKSFIAEGRLERIADRIGPNDYLFIQFGHNDSKPDEQRATEPYSTYQAYLQQYIDVTRSNGATPVLVTPVERRHFTKEGELQHTHGDYPDAMRQLAAREQVVLIDLQQITRAWLKRLGPEESKKYFLWYEPQMIERFPEGVQDDTHFNRDGARQVAQFVVEEMQRLELSDIADEAE